MLNNQYLEYAEWFKSHRWELLITIRTPARLPPHEAVIQEVLRPVAKLSKDQIAAITVLVPRSPTNPSHFHCLIHSKNDRLNISSPEILNHLTKHSAFGTHRDAIDLQPFCDEGAAGYLAKNLVFDHGELHYYNRRLLAANLKG